MQKPNSISRRKFLQISLLAGATVMGASLLDTYSPWLNDQPQINLPKVNPTDAAVTAPMLDLVRYAVRAASGHNTQPWKFRISGNSIQIHPDLKRSLPVVDPHGREMWISLGCALENMLIAARTSGLTGEVRYPDSADFIEVNFRVDTPQPDPLFDAIATRQNTRSKYSGQPIPAADLDVLQRLPLEPGVILKIITQPSEIKPVNEYVYQGNMNQYADQAFVKELVDWLRFNKKEAVTALDGLYSPCSGNPQVPRWLGSLLVTSTKPSQQADADAEKLKSSAGIAILATEADTQTAWVRTGQVYERLALQMTALNIKSAFLNQPIEVDPLRAQLGSSVSLGQASPQLLMRFGYASEMPRSLRRPVEDVLF